MASSYDGHVAKKQRTNDGARGYEESSMDRRNPEVSPVVHVRGLPPHVNEDDIISALQHFGNIEYVMIIHRRNQALVEFGSIEAAQSCVNFSGVCDLIDSTKKSRTDGNRLCISGQPSFINFSTSKRIQRPEESNMGRGFVQGNKIVLFTIANAKYPINVDVMHTICSPHGLVEKIVIFRKQFVQALVQYDNVGSAKAAKDGLHGCDIYSGCCTLRTEYAKTDELNVRMNNSESWDYTAVQHVEPPGRKNAPLLADPRYTTQPTPFNEYDEFPAQEPAYGGSGASGQGGYNKYEQHGEPSYQMAYNSPPQRGRGASGGGRPPAGRGVGRGQQHQQMGAPYQQEPRGGGGYGHQHQQMGHDPGMYGHGSNVQQGGYLDPQAGDAPQQGCVLMVYGLNPDKMNCDRIFNIFCLYGNVCRVKFLKTKEGSAMVQMSDSNAIDRVVFNLNGIMLFDSKLVVTLSKQPYLQVVNNPHDLPDGSPSYKDFTTSKNNRFSNPEQAAKNRIIHPTEILHYFNAPPKVEADQVKELFQDLGAKMPEKILQFGGRMKSERSSTGLVEWNNRQECMDALALVNHTPIDNPEGGRPYFIKLCFSPSNIREKDN